MLDAILSHKKMDLDLTIIEKLKQMIERMVTIDQLYKKKVYKRLQIQKNKKIYKHVKKTEKSSFTQQSEVQIQETNNNNCEPETTQFLQIL